MCHVWDRFGVQVIIECLDANNDAHDPPGSDMGDGNGICSVALPPARFIIVGVRLVVALVVVRLHLDHVAWLEFFDGLVAGRRQDRCIGGEANDGEVGHG